MEQVVGLRRRRQQLTAKKQQCRAPTAVRRRMPVAGSLDARLGPGPIVEGHEPGSSEDLVTDQVGDADATLESVRVAADDLYAATSCVSSPIIRSRARARAVCCRTAKDSKAPL